MRMLSSLLGFSGIGVIANAMASLAATPLVSRSIRVGAGSKAVTSRSRRSRTKWSGADLRAIRARNGIGRPPVKG